MPGNGRLDGKVTIVTGATSGIGRRSAELFAEEGAYVVLAGRRADLGEAAANAIGERAKFIQTDVTNEAEVRALIDETVAWKGRLDSIFNNAGGPAPTGGIEGIELEGVNQAMAVLFNGVFLCMKHAARVMRPQGGGSIINNGSIAAHQAGRSSSMIYSAAKAAVVHFTRCAAMELGEAGIRVNSVSPGAIVTGIFGKAQGLTEADAEQTTTTLETFFAGAQPIRRAGQPDDIARAALYLASDDSTFVNGTDIVVDGGMIGGRHWSDHQAGQRAMRQAFGIDE